MNIEKFTNKSREALMAARQLAESANHTELRPLHSMDCQLLIRPVLIQSEK